MTARARTAEMAEAVESLDGAHVEGDQEVRPAGEALPGAAEAQEGGDDAPARDEPHPAPRGDAHHAPREDLFDAPAEAPLTVGALAERLGVSPSTLRSWDRRYGLGASDHRPGERRRYGPADVVRLERMRALTQSGVSPADAARAVTRPGSGFGEVVPVGVSATSLDVRSLAAAASVGDRADVRMAIARHVDAHGWTGTWQRLLSPACDLLAVGAEPQPPGGDGITVLTGSALEVVRTTVVAQVTDEHVRVVIHTVPRHVLAAHVLAGAMGEHGVATRLRRVGRKRVPKGALQDVTGSGARTEVLVGFGRAASARAIAGRDVTGGPAVVLVGPGLPRHVPERAVLAAGVPEAVSAVTALLDGADLA